MAYSVFYAMPTRRLMRTTPRGLGGWVDDLSKWINTGADVLKKIKTPDITVTTPWPSPVPVFGRPLPQGGQLPLEYGVPATDWTPYMLGGLALLFLMKRRG